MRATSERETWPKRRAKYRLSLEPMMNQFRTTMNRSRRNNGDKRKDTQYTVIINTNRPTNHSPGLVFELHARANFAKMGYLELIRLRFDNKS